MGSAAFRLAAAGTLALATFAPMPGTAEGVAGPVVVEVRGRGGRLLEGVAVYRRSDEAWVPVGQTGADGTLALPDGAGSSDGELTASASRFEPSRGDPRRGRIAKVVGPRTSLSIDCGAELGLDVVDAETGAPLRGATWRVVWRTLKDPTPGTWVPSGTAVFHPVGSDGREVEGFEVGGLDGMERSHVVSRDALIEAVRPGWQSVNGAGSAVLRGVVPVRRALRLIARGTTPGGKPFGARQALWHFVGAPERAAFRGQQEGAAPSPALELVLPWFRGARVLVEAGDVVWGKAHFDMPRALGRGSFDVRVPMTGPRPEVADDGLLTDGLMGVGGGGEDVPVPEGVRLEVTVLQADGTPRADAQVEVSSLRRRAWRLPDGRTPSLPAFERTGFTDVVGRVQLERLPPGRYAVVVSHRDALPARREIDLDRPGAAVPLVVKEPVGATVDVTVTDATGAVLPFAAVVARGPLESRGGLGDAPLRLDPYTDVRGRRRIRRIDPGAIRIQAWYGPLQGETVVHVADGAVVSAKVVVTQSE